MIRYPFKLTEKQKELVELEYRRSLHEDEHNDDRKKFKQKLKDPTQYYIRREYPLGKTPYRDFKAEVLDSKNDSYKVRFVDNQSKEVVDWFPAPGKGRLSGRFYDEELIKTGERGKYVGGDSRANWPTVGEAQNASKTEHSGAKKGKGAYYGRKKDAKRDSDKKRRQNDKAETNEEVSRMKKLAGINEVKAGKFNSKMIGQRVKIMSKQDSFGNDHYGEEGVVTRASREHTFSQMVPFIIEYGVKLDSGESITIRRDHVRKVKNIKESGMYNHKNVWIEDAKKRGYDLEPGGDGKIYAIDDGEERGYWDPNYGGFGTGIFHKLKESRQGNETNTQEMARLKRELKHARDPDKRGYLRLEIRKLQGEIDLRKERAVKETSSGGATGAGAVASAPAALGDMQGRSIYGKPKKKAKQTKEEKDDGLGRSKKE